MCVNKQSVNASDTPKLDIRREIHFEHTQIGQRMGWYTSSQAFMFTAYALSGNYQFEAIPQSYLPSLGMSLSVLAWIAIVMAVLRLWGWSKQQPKKWKPNWGLHWLALSYPILTPIAIGFVWFKLW